MNRLTKALALALGAAVLLRLVLLAWLPLMDPAEGRYGEISRKMAELGDWITPWHQYGVPFWGKPPLSFWMTAASLDWFGINEFAARLPHFLAGVATALCVWNVARNGHEVQAAGASTSAADSGSHQRSRSLEALMAAAMLGTGLLFFLSSGAVMTDAALVLGTTMATMGAWLAMAGIDGGQRRRQGWLAFLGGAVGILAKGPLALVLVGTPLLLWAAWNGRWRVLWTALPWVRGVLLMVALTAPWFLAAEMKTPGFFEYFFVGEHFHRFATPGWSGDLYGKAHHEPKGTIWLYAAGACLPWTLLLPALALRRLWAARAKTGARPATPPSQAGTQNPPQTRGPWNITPTEESRFVMLWALVPLLFFTVSSNIIWTYVLPAMPGLAWWAARWMGRRPEQGMRWTTAGVWVAVGAWAALAVVADRIGRLDRASAKALVVACDAAWARHHGAPMAAQQARDGLRGDEAEPRLILLGRRSFSSHFYTHGRTLRVDALDEVGTSWPAAGVCLAVKEDDPDSMAAAQAGVRIVEALGSHHERRLWWVHRP